MEQQHKVTLKKGDTVMVIAGKEIGKSGKILKVEHKKHSVIIEKVNFIKRHARPSSKTKQGGIIEREGPIHASNVGLLCPRCNVPVRIKKAFVEDKRKVRACTKCGELFDK
jgi:large subunit ribosomal protein L24